MLRVSNNVIEKLPKQLGALSSLRELAVDGNPMRRLPPLLTRLTALTRLHLDETGLQALPPGIGSLAALADLQVGMKPSLPHGLLSIAAAHGRDGPAGAAAGHLMPC